MNICILTHTFPRNKNDVAAAFMKEFSDGLTKIGHKVFVVTPYDVNFERSGDPFKIITYKYIWPLRFHLLGYSRSMDSDVSLRKKTFFLVPFLIFFGTIALFRVVKKNKIDIINVHWILPSGLIAFFVSKVTGVPYVVTLPGTDAYLAYKYRVFGFISKVIANNSIGIVSNSSWHLKRILNLGIEDKKTEVISYPADVSKFRPSNRGLDIYRQKYGLRKEDFIILAVGRLVYKKGFDYLISAMTRVLKRYPNAYLMIGGDGDLRLELESQARKLKISNKVIFVSTIAREEIIKYYNLCDIFVAPSVVDKYGNVDGGPLVSLESMACGKPQILTNILGMADEMEDGVNGFIVPQRDVIALSEAIIKLIKSRKLREKMGEENRKLAQKMLSTKNIAKRYSVFFQSVLETS